MSPAEPAATAANTSSPSPASKLVKDLSFSRASRTKPSPNNAGLPSLKQLSDRLQPSASVGTNTTAKPALNDVTVSTTNLPTSSSGPSLSPSRLKLPQSAMQRANISPPSPVRGASAAPDAGTELSAGKTEKDVVANKVDKEAQDSDKDAQSTDSRADLPNNSTTASAGADATASVTAADKEGSSKATEWRRGGRAGLGVGFPGAATSGPETPSRPAAIGKAVPEIVVEAGTPTKDVAGGETTPRTTTANGEHPLAHPWTIFYDSKTYKPDPATVKKDDMLNEWEASLLTVGTFDTIEGFCRHVNNIRMPSAIAKHANYHLFKDGIRPMWEDPANKDGGKWVALIRSSPGLMDHVWSSLSMALVGEMLDPEDGVCGIVVSARPKMDRIQVWTRKRDNIEYLNTLAARIVDFMGLEPSEMGSVSLEFQGNAAGSTPPPGVLTRIPFGGGRSVSVAAPPSADSPRGGGGRMRNPSSPVMPSSPLGSHSLTIPGSPRAGGGAPMRRGGSGGGGGGSGNGGGNNAFSGPMGSPRRLVSTPASGGA